MFTVERISFARMGMVAVKNTDGKPYVEVAINKDTNRVFSPEEVSAMVLTKMKETAEVSRLLTQQDPSDPASCASSLEPVDI